jgi:ribonuclease T2
MLSGALALAAHVWSSNNLRKNIMSSFLALLTIAANFGLHASAFSQWPNTRPDLAACLDQPIVFSCENTTAIEDSCCTVAKGGLVLQTQFWDTYTGFEKESQLLPKDSWTVHGLWPDNCDG